MRCEIPRLSQTDFFNLPNALLALAMWLVTSALMLAERDSVLPRYVKFSTAWSLCPFTVMLGSWYGFPGAGWYITSVSLVLMVKPKLSQAVENPSISSCISCSLLAFSAQSSAKTRSLITVSLTLLTAYRRRGLNSFPSHLYLMGMPGEVSLRASISIAENNRLNSVGASPRRFHHQALGPSSRREIV